MQGRPWPVHSPAVGVFTSWLGGQLCWKSLFLWGGLSLAPLLGTSTIKANTSEHSSYVRHTLSTSHASQSSQQAWELCVMVFLNLQIKHGPRSFGYCLLSLQKLSLLS